MKKKLLIALAVLSIPAAAQGANLYQHRAYRISPDHFQPGHASCLHGKHTGDVREIIMCGFTKAECEDERHSILQTPGMEAECQ